ncbi:MAG: Phage protein [Edwardsiella phage MSW-3]|uniref:Phage neck terminator protein gp12-like domain-containing protein n=1 Tax=Edwardsiella phage MSW-3 TaxID=1264700 RepID=L0MZ20_9CAUD|nr:hypothetical protein G428_gp24 [Edwardsiella phage MSW-3]BAM68845.1 hypothetical protein [Edwardsiella phage MSW-3]BEU28751.1 MAG: Phage protein [Edwardsiella phage MSW-3]
MTSEQLFKLLRPIVMTATGVPECILADPNAQAPHGPYAALRPRQTVSQLGQADIIDKNAPGDQVRTTVRSRIVCTCVVNFYRGEARMYAERLRNCNKLPSISAKLFKAGLGWAGVGNINDLTALQSANFEQRAHVEFTVWYTTDLVDEVNNILSAEVQLQNETGATIQTVKV